VSVSRLSLALALMTLASACANFPRVFSSVAGRTTYTERQTTRLLEAPLITESENLARAQEAVTRIATNFGLSPAPELRVLKGATWLLVGRDARAVLFESGTRALYLSRENMEARGDLDPVIEHEMAHFAAWEKYGFGIYEHGAEWTRICRAHATSKYSCTETR
jgi:hypothetical protein